MTPETAIAMLDRVQRASLRNPLGFRQPGGLRKSPRYGTRHRGKGTPLPTLAEKLAVIAGMSEPGDTRDMSFRRRLKLRARAIALRQHIAELEARRAEAPSADADRSLENTRRLLDHYGRHFDEVVA